jgi:hypothetical protein
VDDVALGQTNGVTSQQISVQSSHSFLVVQPKKYSNDMLTAVCNRRSYAPYPMVFGCAQEPHRSEIDMVGEIGGCQSKETGPTAEE